MLSVVLIEKGPWTQEALVRLPNFRTTLKWLTVSTTMMGWFGLELRGYLWWLESTFFRSVR